MTTLTKKRGTGGGVVAKACCVQAYVVVLCCDTLTHFESNKKEGKKKGLTEGAADMKALVSKPA